MVDGGGWWWWLMVVVGNFWLIGWWLGLGHPPRTCLHFKSSEIEFP